MSNNREVDWDGDNWCFIWDDAVMVADIERDPQGHAEFSGDRWHARDAAVVRHDRRRRRHGTRPHAIRYPLDQGARPLVQGRGQMRPALAMIQVRATRAHYWNGEDEGEVALWIGPSTAPIQIDSATSCRIVLSR